MKFKLLIVLLFFSTLTKAGDFSAGKDSVRQGTPFMQEKSKPGYFIRYSTKGALEEDKEKKYKRWSNLRFSGYARSFLQYRYMPQRYAEGPSSERNITFNGYEVAEKAVTGYQEPLLLVRIEGNPTTKTFFQIEYAFDNQMTGNIIDGTGRPLVGLGTAYTRRASVYRILQFQGGIHTNSGTFKIIAGGGVNWYRLSPFTLWNYEYRDDMFERYPWEPEGNAFNRYNSFYALQNIARDARWGNTGTQGFIIEAKDLPKGFGAVLLFGKTDNSGGFQSYISRAPKNMASGRVEKKFKTHSFALNYFNQFGATDAVGLYGIKQKITTADARINFEKVKVFVEAGLGKYQDSVINKENYNLLYGKELSTRDTVAGLNNNWMPCINIQADFDKELTFIPLNLQFYYIDKSVVNINSQVMNSANPHALPNLSVVGTQSDITTFQGVITDIGQMTNNRWAVNLKHEDTYGKLKLMVAASAGQEIENLYNTISYQHRANQFTRSRFAYFRSGFGPYGRLVNLFRRSFEKISITDTTIDYKKGYNSLDMSLKYKLNIFNRPLILSNYANYSSVVDKFSATPKFNDGAFVRYFYEELMAFYAIHSKVTLVGFFSMERAIGNDRTEADVITKKFLDQTGHGYGFGIDYDFASKAGLYLRHRWFDHKDVNFVKDVFKGQETSLELKVFF